MCYFAGFGDCQDAYSPYPTALLCVRYINEVGKIIIGDCNLEAGEMKEGDKICSASDQSHDTMQVSLPLYVSVDTVCKQKSPILLI
jgi:hypothetical protein